MRHWKQKIVLIGVLYWLTLTTAWAGSVSCKIKGHTTPHGNWKTTSIRLVERSIKTFKSDFSGPLLRYAYPILKLTPAFNITPGVGMSAADYIKANNNQRNLVKLLFKDTFAYFGAHHYPFPTRWGIHKNGVIDIYCGGSGTIPGEVGGMAFWPKAERRMYQFCAGGSNTRFMTLALYSVLFDTLGSKPYDMIETIAHEVFHILQHHAPIVDKPLSFPKWWKESTARVVGNHFRSKLSQRTKRQYRKAMKRSLPSPPKPWRGTTVYRDFHRFPLDYKSVIGPKAKGESVYYHTEAFWRYLAEYHEHRSKYPYLFLKDMLYDKRANKYPKHADKWLTLTHSHLVDKWRLPLGHAFASFLAYTAAQYRREKGSVSSKAKTPPSTQGNKDPQDAAWMKKWFGHKCPLIELSANAKQITASAQTVKLAMLTGTCIRVRVNGLAPDTSSVSIKVMSTRHASSTFTSQLSLGMAYSTSADRYICARPGQEQTNHSILPNCLLPPIDGSKRKTWRVPLHRVKAGQTSFDTVYVLTRAPLPIDCHVGKKRCIKKMNRLDRGVISVRLTFAVQATTGGKRAQKKPHQRQKTQTQKRAKGNQATPKVPERQYIVAEPTPLPMMGLISADLDLSSIPLSGPVRDFRTGRPLRHLFHGNIANRMIVKQLKAKGKTGLRGMIFHLVQEKTRSDQLGDVELKTLETYSLILTKQLTPGMTGTFKGVIIGRSLSSPSIRFFSLPKSSGGVIPKIFANPDEMRKTATLKIFAFSKLALRATLTDTLCQIDMSQFNNNKKPKCQKIIPFRLAFTNPFPHFYTANDTFKTLDTPGMEQFRKYQQPLMLKYAKIIQQNSSQSAAPKGTRGQKEGQIVAGAMGAKCSCSCKEKERFEALQRQRMQQPTGSPPPPGYVNLMTCHTACQASYKHCKSKQKSPCDCSCSYRKKMNDLQRELASKGKPMTPALKAFYKCMMVCAVSYGKCFR